MSERDTQSNKYQLTVNNPAEKKITHKKIKDRLIKNFSTLTYFCMADEKGTTYHTHIYVHFTSRVRFSMLKRYFKEFNQIQYGKEID